MVRSALVALLVAGAALASPLQARTADYALKDAHPVPRRWREIGAAPAGHVLKLEIGLKQGQFAELDRQLMEGERVVN